MSNESPIPPKVAACPSRSENLALIVVCAAGATLEAATLLERAGTFAVLW